jgi:hypothetical protein
VYLPTSYGLGLHRRLRKLVDAEIEREEWEMNKRWRARAAEFKKIEATFPPAARL